MTPPERQATSVPRTSRRSPRISPAPAPRQTSPAARIRRAAVGCASASARNPAISAAEYGCFARSRGSGSVRRVEVRHGPAADEPQVRAQRPPRRPGQARRAAGEPLGRRRVQQHLRHRLQAQPDAVVGELARRPQQALRPLPSRRPRPRDHAPGRTPPPAATPTTASTARYRRQPQHSPFHTALILNEMRGSTGTRLRQ